MVFFSNTLEFANISIEDSEMRNNNLYYHHFGELYLKNKYSKSVCYIQVFAQDRANTFTSLLIN